MSAPGLGVMIGFLGGNERTVEAYHKAVGQKIARLALDEERDELRVGLADGMTLVARDDGQSCCEHRYMRTDDTLNAFVGATLTGIEIKDAPDQEDEYGDVHEVQFLEVQTSAGAFTVANHNEHNGYYGGFWLTLTLETAA